VRPGDYGSSAQTLFTQSSPAPHWMQAAVQFAPVVLLSGAQVPVAAGPHRWKPVLQARTQDVPLQLTVPFAGAVQVVQLAPQASFVLLATQVGAVAVPRRQKPGTSQTTRQPSVPVALSHTAMPFAGGAGQAVQEVPHELRLVFDEQAPVPAGQRWKFGLQTVPQAFAVQLASAFGSVGVAQVWHEAGVPHCRVLSSGKQPLTPGHWCVPAPQTTPQAALTQAVPCGQGVQSTPLRVPQAFDELLPTQMPLQRWKPVLHAGTHVPAALQVTVPLSGASQTVHELPHELMLVLPLTTQVRLAPVPHW
jgi:hypothetical protein